MSPAVSIILPTYNRARFLPQAFESIRAQTFTDWELIVVDDGSTDDSRDIVQRMATRSPQPVRYLYQSNQGPAAARNAGLDTAVGNYVAFFDSDDSWIPDHLSKAVKAFREVEVVDWIFSASRRVDHGSGKVLVPNTFLESPGLARFRDLETTSHGDLMLITDDRLRVCALRGSGMGGLQTSVVKRQVFDRLRFQSISFFEDRIALVHAIASGIRFGYFDAVHVDVFTHSQNVSFANSSSPKRILPYVKYARALKEIHAVVPTSKPEETAARLRLAHEYFWSIGYPLFQAGRRRAAIKFMYRALCLCPRNLRFRKTYYVCSAKMAVDVGRR